MATDHEREAEWDVALDTETGRERFTGSCTCPVRIMLRTGHELPASGQPAGHERSDRGSEPRDTVFTCLWTHLTPTALRSSGSLAAYVARGCSHGGTRKSKTSRRF